jgi:hypothetical protein
MNVQHAIMTFTQSEKVKSGIIWATSSVEHLQRFLSDDRQGAITALRTFVGMIIREVHLSKKYSSEETWLEVEKHVDMALVMIDSGVPQEASFHLTRALTQVTSISHRSMKILKEQGLL